MKTSNNQRIIENFVERHVFLNLTGLVGDLIENAEVEDVFEGTTFVWGDRVCEDCENVDITPEWADDRLWYICGNCGKEYTEEEYNDELAGVDLPSEYYAVSSFLANRLKEHGEVVIENWGLFVWGRRGGGQRIVMDDVFWDIAEEQKILVGQSGEHLYA